MLLSRENLSKILGVNPKLTYKFFNGREGEYIHESLLIDFLNRHRINIVKIESPFQLYSVEDLNKNHTIDGETITAKDILRIAKRTLFPIPHYKFSNKTIRFPKYAVDWWFEQKALPLQSRGEYNERIAREKFQRNSRGDIHMDTSSS